VISLRRRPALAKSSNKITRAKRSTPALTCSLLLPVEQRHRRGVSDTSGCGTRLRARRGRQATFSRPRISTYGREKSTNSSTKTRTGAQCKSRLVQGAGAGTAGQDLRPSCRHPPDGNAGPSRDLAARGRLCCRFDKVDTGRRCALDASHRGERLQAWGLHPVVHSQRRE
jgi:hypothetical protein